MRIFFKPQPLIFSIRSALCAVSLATSALPLASFATVTIPDAGKPGGALPIIPTPFSTTMPHTIGPLNNKTETNLPSVSNPSDFQFKVEKIEVSGISPHSSLDSDQINKIAEKLRLKYQDKNGELSVENLNQIADILTSYFAHQGYFLTKVYLPPQDITHERIVQLQVREGFLEAIKIQGESIYSDNQLKAPFKKYLGKPITAGEIESGLLTLRDYPGLEVNSIFQPGDNPAGTVMIIQITQSDRIGVSVAADNYGNNVTGKYQGTVTAHAYNLTQGADDLSFTFLQKFDPTNSELYAGEYTRNLFGPSNQINLGYSYNKYSLGDTLSNLGLGGLSQLYHVSIIQSFMKSRLVELEGKIGLNHDMGYLKQYSTTLNRDKITYAQAEMDTTFNMPTLNLVNINQLIYQHGFNHFLDSMGTAPYQGYYPSRQGGSGEYAKGEFNLGSLGMNFYQSPANYQLIELQLYGQYSPDLLTSFSQLTFGGQSALPAYDTSEYLVDKGFTSHLEWKFPLPGLTSRMVPKTNYRFGDLLHLSIFTDYGNGWLNDPSADETPHVVLADYGVGLYLAFGPHLQLQAQAAKHWPGMTAPEDNEPVRYWVGLNYAYTGF
jgi:hemolysin activation/secretion protein